MNEERIKAYLKLINALLNCSSGEELAILNSNQDLIDADLVQLMECVSVREAEEGEHDLANRLQNLASQLVMEAEANRLLNQGVEQFEFSQLEAAFQSWQQALTIYRDLGHRLGEAKSIGHLGLIFYSRGQYQEALDHHQQHLEIAREIDDRLQEAKSLGNLGNTYYRLRQYKKAIECHQWCLDIMQERGDTQGKAIALSGLGDVLNSVGRYQQAIQRYQQCLDIMREIGDRRGEAISMNGLGNAFCSLGQYQQAIQHHQQCLDIMREREDRQGEATSLNSLGNAFCAQGQYDQAFESYQQSLEIAQAIGDPLQEGKSLGNLGNVYLQIGQYQTALEFHHHSLKIAREIGDFEGEATSLSSLGNAYHVLGQYQQAIKYHQQSLDIEQKIGNRSGEGKSLNNLGNAYDSQEQYQKAIEFYQQSLDIAQEIDNPEHKATSLNNLGNAYDSRGQYQKAIESYQQSLDIAQKIGDPTGEATSLANLGNVYYCQGQYQQGIENHQLSLNIARQIGDLRLQGLSLSNLGAALLKSGQFVEADRLLRAGIQVWESLRLGLEDTHKVSIFDTQIRTYRLLQEALVAQKKTNDALEISERGRARAFVESLAKRLAAKPLESIQEARLQEAINPPSIDKIKQIAKEQKSTIVEYSIIDSENLYIWVIKDTGEIYFDSVDLQPLLEDYNSLEQLAKDTCEIIERGSFYDFKLLLQQLYQYLIEPIASLFPSDPNASVIFIPQGNLFLVPFPALQDTNGKFLIEQYTILTAPSIQVLELTHKQRQRIGTIDELPLLSKNVLVVGNPIMPIDPYSQPPKQLNPLPYAEEEAKQIASFFNTKALLAKNATKVDIVQQMPKVGLIHLATHGLLNNIGESGIPGAIALAPSGNDHGLLSSDEILDLDLNAELVVLSACNSGRGTITGDGVIGLSRCLFLAGVPSLIVSLWEVQDSSTKLLMTEFYRNLQNGMNKAQSLRQAMLTTMEQYSHPVNWAAFTLIGEAA